MRITIIGGHGRVAMLAVPMLVKAGHRVSSVIRNPEHVGDVRKGGSVAVVADVEQLDVQGIRELIRGSDAIVWSAGAGGGNPERTRAVDKEAAIRTIDAAVAEGVGRFVMVSYVGSGRDRVPEESPFKTYADAKAAADEHLRASSLNWTILAPGRLTDDEATHHIDYGHGVKEADTSRGNVAEAVALTVGRFDLGGAMIRFHDGHIGIHEALYSIARQVAGTPVAAAREGHGRSSHTHIPAHLTGRRANP